MRAHPLALDELYERLKAHDPGLQAVLQSRWNDLKASRQVPHASIAPVSATCSASTALELARRPSLALPIETRGAGIRSTHLLGPWDITAPELKPGRIISDHDTWVRQFDWASTDLGPMTSWSSALRQAVNYLLADPRAALLCWGEQRTCIYNAKYIGNLAHHHPTAMGMPVADLWPELEDHDFGHAFAKADTTGEASSGDSSLFLLERAGFLEEVYGDWSMIPIWGGDDDHGYYNSAHEVTAQVLYQRQMGTLLRLDKHTADVTDVKQFWRHLLMALEPNRHEVPFAALYATQTTHDDFSDSSSIDDIKSRSSSSAMDTRLWSLEGTIGIQNDSEILPTQVDSAKAADIFTPLFEECLGVSRIQLLQASQGTLSSTLQSISKSRVSGDPCMEVVLCPIGPAHRGVRSGFLLLGISPTREYDRSYQQFVQLLVRQSITCLASVSVGEDEARQAKRVAQLAQIERDQLSERLALTEMEVKQNEHRFREVGEHMPVAMYEATSTGDILYGNDNYFKLMGLSPYELSPMCFIEAIHPDSRQEAERHWNYVTSGQPHRSELRLNKPYDFTEEEGGFQTEKMDLESWVLMSSVPIKGGQIVQGLMTDISRQKWMENSQRRKMDEAIERRRQQENFMDIIAHEARNPLSAITLCTDNILSTIQDVLKGAGEQVTFSRDTVETHLENAEIIMTCAQHQKRIIDDVLTLSKLDAGLLVIAPSKVQPTECVRQAMKMFDGDLQQAAVDIQYIVDPSYRELKIDWVKLDPGRLLQVLINLVTNAIKFTKTQELRSITITLSASTTPPTSSTIQYLDYADARTGKQELHDYHYEERDKSAVYIMITVADTGCGMKESTLRKLFHRWQQASPKTYTEYGGSGLGLFISKELARLQGGKIGVASEFGVGSTFAFYIDATRCSPLTLKRVRSSSHDSNRSDDEGRRAWKSTIQDKAEILMDRDVPPADVEAPPEVLHLLLVEDNLVNQKVMSKQLIRAGYKVTIANHGGEALEHIRKTASFTPNGLPLDTVLMDIEMPIMDGIECTRRIREMEAKGELAGHVGILAVTANVRAEQQAAAVSAGMDAVVTKPFRMMELLPALKQMQLLHGSMPRPDANWFPDAVATEPVQMS